METIYARDGRLVLESANSSGYGLEIAGLIANDKFQVRATRFGDYEGSIATDLEHESSWCSTFSDLRVMLGEAGNEIMIEKALAVGEKPLKVVQRNRRTEAKRRVSRTLDNN